MKKIIKTLRDAVVGSVLFVGMATMIAVAVVSMFRH